MKRNHEKTKVSTKNTLKSILNLKHGNSDEFAELVQKAMDATDNIMSIKKSREIEQSDPFVKNTSKHNNKAKNSCESGSIKEIEVPHNRGANASSILDIIESFGNRECEKREDKTISDERILKMQLKLLEQLKVKSKGQTKGENAIDMITSDYEKEIEQNEPSKIQDNEKKSKKMTSGKMCKTRRNRHQDHSKIRTIQTGP